MRPIGSAVRFCKEICGREICLLLWGAGDVWKIGEKVLPIILQMLDFMCLSAHEGRKRLGWKSRTNRRREERDAGCRSAPD